MGMIQLDGKSSTLISREYGVTPSRVWQWAQEHDLPFVSSDGGKTASFYLFDAAAEAEFVNRRRESPGRTPAPKPPRVPGKPGRPRKEKPADAAPKRPVGRPRKSPEDPLDIASRPQGRPKKQRKNMPGSALFNAP